MAETDKTTMGLTKMLRNKLEGLKREWDLPSMEDVIDEALDRLDDLENRVAELEGEDEDEDEDEE